MNPAMDPAIFSPQTAPILIEEDMDEVADDQVINPPKPYDFF